MEKNILGAEILYVCEAHNMAQAACGLIVQL
jgi:hypothetical protein